MKDLEKLQAELSRAIETHAKCQENIKDKSEEINNLNLELSELSPRATEVARLLDNSKKGIGMSLSMDEFTSLKKELEDKNIRIQDLKEFIPMMKVSLSDMNSQSQGNSRQVRFCKDQITDILADKVAAEIALQYKDKLTELLHSEMALGGLTFISADFYYLYGKIGERIFKQIYNNENKSFVLPTIHQAISERDLLLDNLK